ncbi:MAG: 4a-hydroxytetrahydrobiopterin dehydratase [Labilithrix sp.]
MARPEKLPAEAVDAWLAAHGEWSREREGLVRAYRFGDFSGALAFVVRVGLIAEKRDHHPDIELGWGKARVFWTTHDAGGITQLDLDLAAASDAIFGG